MVYVYGWFFNICLPLVVVSFIGSLTSRSPTLYTARDSCCPGAYTDRERRSLARIYAQPCNLCVRIATCSAIFADGRCARLQTPWSRFSHLTQNELFFTVCSAQEVPNRAGQSLCRALTFRGKWGRRVAENCDTNLAVPTDRRIIGQQTRCLIIDDSIPRLHLLDLGQPASSQDLIVVHLVRNVCRQPRTDREAGMAHILMPSWQVKRSAPLRSATRGPIYARRTLSETWSSCWVSGWLNWPSRL